MNEKFQVEEIESVLGNAFQAAAMTSRSIAPQQHNDQLVPQKPHQLRPQSKSIITPQRFINSGVMPPPGNRRYSSNRTSTILIDSNPASLQSHPTPLLITDTKGTRIGKTDTVASNVSSDTAKGSVMESKACLNGTTDRVTPLMATPVTTKQRPLCTSAALLNRLFGGHLSSKSRMNSELFSNKENAVDAASGIGKNEDSTKINPPLKRRRRPVSAVFSQAFHRLSSSTSIYNSNKRVSWPFIRFFFVHQASDLKCDTFDKHLNYECSTCKRGKRVPEVELTRFFE
ncbi:unnamed protein product [Anisakis simplex]|uniref:Uncharacterized protein n=1 Tax=Anisakis simplex TaxID=6269 RepID=A0A0M3KE53_ANISI|nr:unnamed protein product [Anisakis simplex]